MIASSLIGHIIQLLEKIDADNQPADKITAEFFRAKKYLGARDRRYISEIVYGMIRHRKFIRTLVKEYVHQHPAATSLEGPHVRYLSQAVAYSMAIENNSFVAPHLWKTQFPKVDLEEFSQWMKSNSTLHFLSDDPVIQLSNRYSFPEWLVNDLFDKWGDQTEQLLQSLNIPAPTVMRVNTFKTNRDECMNRLMKDGIETTRTSISSDGLIALKRFNIQTLQSFHDGWFEIQDEGSQLVSQIIAPKQGMTIIDGCAGAGGKSLHMSVIMKNQGNIFSIDTNTERLHELMTRSKRAGITNIRTIARSHLRSNELVNKADIVLVDAPCSGTGTIRRNPGLKWSLTEALIQKYVEKQHELLSFNSQFVKPGGRIVYVTCSILKQENEDVVNAFLLKHEEFEPDRSENLFSAGGYSFQLPFVSLMPHLHNTDGFFIAVLERAVN
jgi:16S rRNA (cytosine967-C5)-methyltransferase